MSMVSSPYFYSFALFLSLSFLFFFFVAPQILPLKHPPQPISPSDDLDDFSLFRNATLSATSSSARASPKISHLSIANPKPKIAFLFLTNSDLVFAPLWAQFFGGGNNEHLYNIYVHADPLSKLKNPTHPIFQNRFIPAKRTERASPTLISAERRLLAHAIIDDPMNLYFALVSQTCIPLHSFQFVYNSLFGNQFKILKTLANQSKLQSYIEILSDDPNLPERYDARGKDMMLPEVPYEKFRVGSQFFVLAKRHALLVLRDRKLWRKFKLPCLNLNSCYPEEHYFPTLLSMKDPKGCSHYTLTRVNWTDSVDGHPHMYNAGEVTAELIHTLRESNSSSSYFFARKFSPDCLKPLMKLAADVIFRD